MTYKRFIYRMGDGFTDNGKHMNAQEVVDLLNELHEENQRLKGEIDNFIKGIQESAKLSADSIIKQYRDDYE